MHQVARDMTVPTISYLGIMPGVVESAHHGPGKLVVVMSTLDTRILWRLMH